MYAAGPIHRDSIEYCLPTSCGMPFLSSCCCRPLLLPLLAALWTFVLLFILLVSLFFILASSTAVYSVGAV